MQLESGGLLLQEHLIPGKLCIHMLKAKSRTF